MSILDGIKKAFQVLPEIAGSVGQLAITVVILATVIGSFIYQTVTAGNINVDNTSSTLISGTSGNFSNITSTVWTATNSVAGFIVIGVLLLLATSLLGKRFMGNSKL